jgi:hypothetical protein
MSDRIDFDINELSFKFGPMSLEQKASLEEFTKMKKGRPAIEHAKASMRIIKYTVKELLGVETMDGKPYSLEFEDKNQRALTDNCVEDLVNLPCTPDLITTLFQLLEGVKNKVVNLETGEELKHVKIKLPKSFSKKKEKE